MLTVKAPAKVNWFLNVLSLREDGYHEIRSLLQKVTLFDTLTLKRASDFILTCDMNIPPEENLVYRAGILLKKRYGITMGAEMRLVKNIPSGAGLGGGSSDAAAALRGLNEFWALQLSPDELCETGELVGSDVPFFLHGPLSFVEGRGEKVIGHSCRSTLSLLLVKPSCHVSTAWAYSRFSFPASSSPRTENRNSELTKNSVNANNIKHFIRCVEEANLPGIARCAESVSNDLESVILRSFPIIATLKDRLIDHGALFTLMSGSGPTVFGVFPSFQEAEEASRHFSDVWTAPVRTIVEEG
jgi:4-diphosphocytidyl-2-C-methyl-D-erythritol kinase